MRFGRRCRRYLMDVPEAKTEPEAGAWGWLACATSEAPGAVGRRRQADSSRLAGEQ